MSAGRDTGSPVTGFDLAGPRRGADRAVLLAHGAGSDRQAPVLTAVADALAAAGIPSLRFDFPYRAAGRRAPDRAPTLLSSAREAASLLARRTGVPPGRLVLGGRSMGGRMCSLLAAGVDDPWPALGLLLLGYPLHPAGKPDQRRDEHFPRLAMPVRFVSGTRDALAGRTLLQRSSRRIRGPVTFHWIEGSDHGFRPLRSTGLTADDVIADVAADAVTWVSSLAP